MVGAGAGTDRLRKLAPPNVSFFGWSTEEELLALYRRARALVFPGYDDFGLTPLEAAAAGRPTIAYAGGGALETVVADGSSPTGVLFSRQDADGLVEAIEQFLAVEASFEPARLRAHALRFKRSETRHALAQFLRSGIGSDAVARC